MSTDTIRRLHRAAFWLWLLVGVPASLLLRNSVSWVVFLSVYVIVLDHLLGWRQEHSAQSD